MENSKRFLNAYTKIEMTLCEMLQVKHMSFTQLLTKAARVNATVNHYQYDLIEFAQLRNAITHNRVGSQDDVIAEPHTSVVEAIEKIERALNEPKKVVDVFAHYVYKAQIDDSLPSVMAIKKSKGYSVIPIYDNNVYVGALYDRLFANFFENYTSEKDLVPDIRTLLNYKDKKERVVFMGLDASLYDVLSAFSSAHQKGNTLTAVLISEKGLLNNPPQAIITVADLPHILHELA